MIVHENRTKEDPERFDTPKILLAINVFYITLAYCPRFVSADLVTKNNFLPLRLKLQKLFSCAKCHVPTTVVSAVRCQSTQSTPVNQSVSFPFIYLEDVVRIIIKICFKKIDSQRSRHVTKSVDMWNVNIGMWVVMTVVVASLFRRS